MSHTYARSCAVDRETTNYLIWKSVVHLAGLFPFHIYIYFIVVCHYFSLYACTNCCNLCCFNICCRRNAIGGAEGRGERERGEGRGERRVGGEDKGEGGAENYRRGGEEGRRGGGEEGRGGGETAEQQKYPYQSSI